MTAVAADVVRAVAGKSVTLTGPQTDDLVVTAVHVSPVLAEPVADAGGKKLAEKYTVGVRAADLVDPDAYVGVEIDEIAYHLQRPPMRTDAVVTWTATRTRLTAGGKNPQMSDLRH